MDEEREEARGLGIGRHRLHITKPLRPTHSAGAGVQSYRTEAASAIICSACPAVVRLHIGIANRRSRRLSRQRTARRHPAPARISISLFELTRHRRPKQFNDAYCVDIRQATSACARWQQRWPRQIPPTDMVARSGVRISICLDTGANEATLVAARLLCWRASFGHAPALLRPLYVTPGLRVWPQRSERGMESAELIGYGRPLIRPYEGSNRIKTGMLAPMIKVG